MIGWLFKGPQHWGPVVVIWIGIFGAVGAVSFRELANWLGYPAPWMYPAVAVAVIEGVPMVAFTREIVRDTGSGHYVGAVVRNDGVEVCTARKVHRAYLQSERQVQPAMTLDDWLWNVPCTARLQPGETYTLHGGWCRNEVCQGSDFAQHAPAIFVLPP